MHPANVDRRPCRPMLIHSGFLRPIAVNDLRQVKANSAKTLAGGVAGQTLTTLSAKICTLSANSRPCAPAIIWRTGWSRIDHARRRTSDGLETRPTFVGRRKRGIHCRGLAVPQSRRWQESFPGPPKRPAGRDQPDRRQWKLIERQQDAANRRHLAAIKALATVRELLTPAPSPLDIARRMDMPESIVRRSRAGIAGKVLVPN
jgi:hypothetical protein